MNDDSSDEERFRNIERRCNRLADVLEMLAKNRHERFGHALPFGEFADRHRPASLRCDDPICREAFEAANLELL